MRCKEAKNKLHFFVDNQLLSETEKNKLLIHLSTCKSCTNFKNDLLRCKFLVSNQNEIAPFKLDFADIDLEKQQNRRKTLELISLVAAACFGIIVGMSLFHLSTLNTKNVFIAETKTLEQTVPTATNNRQYNTQNVNTMKQSYYQPMSFFAHYDDFFFTEKDTQE